MSYTKVLIHFVWALNNREHLISKELKSLLLQHIKENSAEEYEEFLYAHHFEIALAKANS